jgi:hypothetical protein
MVPPLSVPPNPWLGTWSRPPDRPAQVALAAAIALLVLALVPGGPRRLISVLDAFGIGDLKRHRRFLFVTSLIAAFLSLGYIAFYLRGGPRAASAATYWLQGRAMSHGHLAWIASDPTASFRSNNLVVMPPDRLSGIFPPGYPWLLATMFLLGAPMLVGPLLAAGLVIATWFLAREFATCAGATHERIEEVGRIAAGLSLVSAALRYQTADALPHGAAALALTVALASALRGRRDAKRGPFVVAGLALGFLVATQPVSAIGVGVGVLACGARDRGRPLLWACAGALPGVLLLLAANRVATGHALRPPTALHFLGMKAALLGTARRLRANLADVANFEPITLLPLLLTRRAIQRRPRSALLAAEIILLHVLVVARLTGGDDAGPGSDAHILADIVPIEHALIALALGLSFQHALPAATAATFAFALGGFAFHVSYDHERIATSDLGRPHYEPDVPREAGLTHGLLFFDDDEGFELAHDPGALGSHDVEAVHMRNDDHDRLLCDLLGHPPTHRYVMGAKGPTVPSWTPPSSDTWRFEAESDIPPIAQTERYGSGVEAIDASSSCASNGRALALDPKGSASASVTIELPVPRGTGPSPRRSWLVTPRVFQRNGPGAADLALVTSLDGPPRAQWSWTDAAQGGQKCTELQGKLVDLGGDYSRAWLVMTARGGSVALDKTTLRAR